MTSSRRLGVTLVALAFCLFLSSASQAGQVHYAVSVIDVGLDVCATIENAPAQMQLVFATDAWGVDQLEQRIVDLQVKSDAGERISVVDAGTGVYSIQLEQPTNLVVSYQVQPTLRQWDHHLTIVTRAHVQLTADALFRLETVAGEERSEGFSGTLELIDLPESWQLLSHYPPNERGVIAVDEDLLIYAGAYHLQQLAIGQSVFTLAFNQELTSYLPILQRMDEVLRYQHSLFGNYKEAAALVVLNPLPEGAKSTLYAGQAVPGLAVLYTQTQHDLLVEPELLLAHLAHETFHLWLAQSFTLYEGIYWFTEGFTRYHEYQILQELGLASEAAVFRLLADEWVATARIQQHTAVPLRVAGAYLFANPAHRVLSYAKGALIAYLFVQQLQQSSVPGHTVADFYRTLYQEYAVPGLPLGNKEVITVMNRFLQDTSFTQQWILEPSLLTVEHLPGVQPYMRAAWLAALPDVALDLVYSYFGLLAIAALGALTVGMYIGTKPKRGP